MIRETTRPPTARCTLPMYMGFLMSEPTSTTCTQLSEVMNISHDRVNRFLLRESYVAEDLFNESKKLLNMVGGTLSVDDSTLDKPYSQHMALVSHFWSGKHHRTVKELNLITLYYTDVVGHHLPVNYRIYDKSENKTKNDYFKDMLIEVLAWGLKPAVVTGDSWYSCINNLKMVKNHQLGLLFAIESNRLVSIEKGQWTQVQAISTISEDGLSVWLRGFGLVKLFRTQLKDQLRHYVVLMPDASQQEAFNQKSFQDLHDNHWKIEQYHRMIKQVCHIESFQVRGKVLILNHIFAALCSYVHLQRMQINDVFLNAYRWQRDLYTKVVASFVHDFVRDKDYLNPRFQNAVNA
jgi:hypothetical protein